MSWINLVPDDWGSFFYGMAVIWVVWVVPAIFLIWVFLSYNTAPNPDCGPQDFCDTGPDAL